MSQVRFAAALLIGFTMLVALLFSADPNIGFDVVVCCCCAILSLVPFVPFKPRSIVARSRIVAACAAYTCALGLALACAVLASAPAAALSTLTTLTIAGIALTAWSGKMRRLRSRSTWANYFDN